MGLIKVSGLGDKGLGEERQDMIQGGHRRRDWGGPTVSGSSLPV